MRRTPLSGSARGAGQSPGGAVLPPPGVGLQYELCRPGTLTPPTFVLGGPGRVPRGALYRVRPPLPQSSVHAKGTPRGFPPSRTLDVVDEVDG